MKTATFFCTNNFEQKKIFVLFIRQNLGLNKSDFAGAIKCVSIEGYANYRLQHLALIFEFND